MGVTYVVLSPEHPLVDQVTTPAQRDAVQAYVREAASKSDLERTAVGKDKAKTGVDTGARAIHPITGEEVRSQKKRGGEDERGDRGGERGLR
jgi:leucyl-tRNA synthetase